MALEPEDRTEDLLENKPVVTQFEAKQSIAQMPRKAQGDCRLVVEFPFSFTKEFLREQSDRLGVNLIDGVDYLREVKKRWEDGSISLRDIHDLSINHSDNGTRLRVEAAK